jgi:ribonuclease HI
MIEVFTDGGSRGNPGDAACAFVVLKDSEVLYSDSKFLGKTTNNQAEYNGLLLGLKYLTKNNLLDAHFYSDSELMVKQIKNLYKVKDSGILKIYLEVTSEISKFKNFEISHIRREYNTLADKLVNKCLDEH